MSYSTSNPPYLIMQAMAGKRIWGYDSEDGASDVDASGYFTNGYALGMRHNDLIFVTDTNASPTITTSHLVNVTTTTVNLSEGVTLGTTVGD